jgi:hypothetical protein
MLGRSIADEAIGRPAALADRSDRLADGDEQWWLALRDGREDGHLAALLDPAVATGRLRVELMP